MEIANPSSTMPGISTPQHFVGYSNMPKIVGHLVPTFGKKVERVVLTGASAGSFGAALNFSMVQDAFGSVRVDPILDSGLPFTDKYMFACMQKRWRAIWGFDASLPSDCKDCFASDGGGRISSRTSSTARSSRSRPEGGGAQGVWRGDDGSPKARPASAAHASNVKTHSSGI